VSGIPRRDRSTPSPGRRWMSAKTRGLLERIAVLSAAGASKNEAMLDLQLSGRNLEAMLSRWVGECRWPPTLPPGLFDVPVKEPAPRAAAPLRRSGLIVTPFNDGVESAPMRDPCGFCGVRFDIHDEFGCKRWRVVQC
jgi:hypothetical protein